MTGVSPLNPPLGVLNVSHVLIDQANVLQNSVAVRFLVDSSFQEKTHWYLYFKPKPI